VRTPFADYGTVSVRCERSSRASSDALLVMRLQAGELDRTRGGSRVFARRVPARGVFARRVRQGGGGGCGRRVAWGVPVGPDHFDADVSFALGKGFFSPVRRPCEVVGARRPGPVAREHGDAAALRFAY
jgi:hypothetical protein